MDQNLKHRLTGAVILVSLAVIFIPVILEGPDREWTPLSHGIPEPPQLDYKARMDLSRPIETKVPPNRAKKAVERPAYKLAEPVRKKTVTLPPKPEPVRLPEPKPEPVRIPEPVPVPVVHEEPKAETLSGWYVQVGSFSRKANASALSKRLRLSGYDARFQKTTSKTGDLYRVMVGPDADREMAEQMRDRLSMELQLKGIVLNFPG